MNLKRTAGWINGYTSPTGYICDNNGYPIQFQELVADVCKAMYSLSNTFSSSLAHNFLIPNIVKVNVQTARSNFNRLGTIISAVDTTALPSNRSIGNYP